MEKASDPVDTICAQWWFHPSETLGENRQRLREIASGYLSVLRLGQLIGAARNQCPDQFTAYDREVAREAAAGQKERGDTGKRRGTADGGTAGGGTAGGGTGGAHLRGDAETAEYLNGRGVTEGMVVRLGRTADATGYGLSPGTPLSYGQAQLFAAAIVAVCDDVAAGRTTWTDQTRQDQLDGAPTAAARQMNTYLRVQFCPSVR